MHLKSGMMRGLALGGSCCIRGVASIYGGNFVVFYHISGFEIWPDKRVVVGALYEGWPLVGGFLRRVPSYGGGGGSI